MTSPIDPPNENNWLSNKECYTKCETGRAGRRERALAYAKHTPVHFIYELVFYDTPAALYTKVIWDSKLYCGTLQLTLIKKSGARAGKTPKSHRLSSN